MTYTVDQLVPVDKLIIKPGPDKYLKQVIETKDTEKNKNRTKEDVNKTKKITNKFKTSYTVGQVVAVDPKIPTYEVGDWVVYHRNLGVKLDLLAKKEPDVNCPIMLRYYDVVGKINNEELNGRKNTTGDDEGTTETES